MKGGRQTVDYRFRGGTDDPNAVSAQRAAQTAFATQRSGGLQLASTSAKIDAAFGDTVVVENTLTGAGQRPVVRLPKLEQGSTGKAVLVTFGTKSTTAQYQLTATDVVNATAAGSATNMTLTSPERVHLYIAIGPDYGWRQVTLSS